MAAQHRHDALLTELYGPEDSMYFVLPDKSMATNFLYHAVLRDPQIRRSFSLSGSRGLGKKAYSGSVLLNDRRDREKGRQKVK